MSKSNADVIGRIWIKIRQRTMIEINVRIICIINKNGNKRVFILYFNRIDSCFVRISQALARDKTSTADSKEEIRYAVRKINQHFYAGNSYFKKESINIRIVILFLRKTQC